MCRVIFYNTRKTPWFILPACTQEAARSYRKTLLQNGLVFGGKVSKAKVASKLSLDWHESNLLRSFAVALRKSVKLKGRTEEQKQELLAIVSWMNDYADALNPLSNFNKVIDQMKNPPWFYEESKATGWSDLLPDMKRVPWSKKWC